MAGFQFSWFSVFRSASGMWKSVPTRRPLAAVAMPAAHPGPVTGPPTPGPQWPTLGRYRRGHTTASGATRGAPAAPGKFDEIGAARGAV